MHQGVAAWQWLAAGGNVDDCFCQYAPLVYDDGDPNADLFGCESGFLFGLRLPEAQCIVARHEAVIGCFSSCE
jgi:hypothetical protein